ncbi:MAG: hypothetical protein AAB477_03300 [Patescibacteria group bacterium]
MNDIEQPQPNKRRRLRIGALILAVAIVFVLFKVNLEKAIDSPQFKANVAYIEKAGNTALLKLKSFFSIKNPINSSIFDKKTQYDKIFQPEKINDYFSIPTDKTINQLSSPIGD